MSSRAWIDTLQPNDSINSNATTPPALIVVQVYQALPGKLQELSELWRAEYLPRYRKAGVRDVWVYTATYGAPMGQVTVVRPISIRDCVSFSSAVSKNIRRNGGKRSAM